MKILNFGIKPEGEKLPAKKSYFLHRGCMFHYINALGALENLYCCYHYENKIRLKFELHFA